MFTLSMSEDKIQHCFGCFVPPAEHKTHLEKHLQHSGATLVSSLWQAQHLSLPHCTSIFCSIPWWSFCFLVLLHCSTCVSLGRLRIAAFNCKDGSIFILARRAFCLGSAIGVTIQYGLFSQDVLFLALCPGEKPSLSFFSL